MWRPTPYPNPLSFANCRGWYWGAWGSRSSPVRALQAFAPTSKRSPVQDAGQGRRHNKMRKELRLIKRLVALFLMLLLSIESFGAVVSDNDGSAFITKAEFDSLKNDFQSQIDQYNTSIDAKIDGAIAAYLAGVKTATKIVSPVLVSNYNEMMWQNRLAMYARWKDWTGYNTYNYQNTDAWVEPNLTQKRHYIRDDRIMIWDSITTAYQYTLVSLGFVFRNGYNGAAFADNAGSVPTALYVRLIKDDDEWCVDNNWPLAYEGLIAPYFVVAPHTIVSKGSLSQYRIGRGDVGKITFGDLVVNTPDTNEWLKYTLTMGHGEPPVYTQFIWESHIGVNNSDWLALWYTTNGVYGTPFDRATVLENLSNMAESQEIYDKTSNLINSGCQFYNIYNYASQQKHAWLYMMLGSDNNQNVNVGRFKSWGGERQLYDFTGTADAAYIDGTFDTVIIQDPVVQATAKMWNDSQTIDVAGQIKLPYWPTEKLQNLTTHLFKFKDSYLKYGQGLPLRLDNDQDGYLQISFDYDVKKIVDDSSQNKKIYIDVKKDDFVSSGTAYADGYKGLVDPNTTSSTMTNLKRYVMETTDGKAQLTIPMKKDESFWLRIAPYSTDLGLYAHMENLQMSMNYNS